MDHLKEREEALITTINHLEDQENWAKAHGHPDLARALCEGQQFILNELHVIQKLMKAEAS